MTEKFGLDPRTDALMKFMPDIMKESQALKDETKFLSDRTVPAILDSMKVMNSDVHDSFSRVSNDLTGMRNGVTAFGMEVDKLKTELKTMKRKMEVEAAAAAGNDECIIFVDII
jgi:archaellum component FlaC